jgi:putative transposase
VTEEAWAEARRCFPVIQRLAKTPKRTLAHVLAAAAELGISYTRVYARLARIPCRSKAHESFAAQTRSRARRLAPLELIDEAIETVYLTRQRPRLNDLVTEIRRRARASGLMPPSRKAVSARLNAKPRREVLARRQGQKAARDRYAPAIGSLEAQWPLALVQID